MALNSIFMLSHVQTFSDEEMMSNYFFNKTAGSGTAGDLAAAFIDTFVPAISAFTVSAVINKLIRVINLGDLTDFVETVDVTAGALADQPLPIFSAVGYTLKLDTRAVRPGSKRISGLSENSGQGGVITDVATFALVNALRELMFAPLTDGSSTWQQVVLKRVREDVVGTVPLQHTYRLPETDDELIFGSVVECLTSPNLSHQVSRGNGR